MKEYQKPAAEYVKFTAMEAITSTIIIPGEGGVRDDSNELEDED